MIPSAFDYHAPATLPEAVALLTRYRDTAKVLSGGQSLLPLLKLRLAQSEHLVDIGRIPGLEYVQEKGGMLCIGGCTREATLEDDIQLPGMLFMDLVRSPFAHATIKRSTRRAP
jgi:aerobic carbon-monoxide dehydrogenase medium subunit